MARPKIEVDVKQLEMLASIHCSVEEMATFLGVHKRTLERRYAAVIEKGRNSGKCSLRRQMFNMAMKGDRTMLIWLSKQHLGMKDKFEETVKQTTTNQTTITYETEWGSTVEQPGNQPKEDTEAV